jgi:hypothetical protein
MIMYTIFVVEEVAEKLFELGSRYFRNGQLNNRLIGEHSPNLVPLTLIDIRLYIFRFGLTPGS